MNPEEALKRFKAHCMYWVNLLSIGNYYYYFVAGGEDEHPAGASINSSELCVTVTLNDFEEKTASIPDCARHEMLEVMVDSLADPLYTMFSEEYVQKLRHDVIHRIEKVLSLPTDREVGYVPPKKRGKK